jgi:hypothetical protein
MQKASRTIPPYYRPVIRLPVWTRSIAAASLLLFAALALPALVVRSLQQVAGAFEVRREGALAADSRVSDSDTAMAEETIREALEPNEPYILVDGSSPETGSRYWVRYALAPHPVFFGGKMNETARLRGLKHINIRWVVRCYDLGLAPDLMTRDAFLEEVRAPHGR